MGPPLSICRMAASPSGVNEVDYCWYPGRETQLQWLRYYLQAQKGMAVTPREVERLYVQVNKFALVSARAWQRAGARGAGGGAHPGSSRKRQSPGLGVRSWDRGLCS